MTVKQDRQDKQDKQDEKDARKEERAEVKREEKETAEHDKATEETARVQAEATAKQGRPTPTQAELDAIRRGEHVILAPDGSPPDGHGAPVDHRLGRKSSEEEELERHGFKKVEKDAEPESGASYKTRQAHPEKQRKHEED